MRPALASGLPVNIQDFEEKDRVYVQGKTCLWVSKHRFLLDLAGNWRISQEKSNKKKNYASDVCKILIFVLHILTNMTALNLKTHVKKIVKIYTQQGTES